MKKTILIILFCGVLVLGITGCANNSESLSAEDKEKIVNEIESYIVQDRKSQDNNYKNSYEVTVINIEVEGFKCYVFREITYKVF